LLFVDRGFRLAYNSTHDSYKHTHIYDALHCCDKYTSNMAAVTVVSRMT